MRGRSRDLVSSYLLGKLLYLDLIEADERAVDGEAHAFVDDLKVG